MMEPRPHSRRLRLPEAAVEALPQEQFTERMEEAAVVVVDGSGRLAAQETLQQPAPHKATMAEPEMNKYIELAVAVVARERQDKPEARLRMSEEMAALVRLRP
jgi:hypothetical protein